VVQGVIGAPHLSRQRERGCDFARGTYSAPEPGRNCAEYESDEAEDAGPGRASPRNLGAPYGLLLDLIQRLSGLLFDLVQAVAGLVRADVGDTSKAVHRLIPRGVGGLLIAADACADIGLGFAPATPNDTPTPMMPSDLVRSLVERLDLAKDIFQGGSRQSEQLMCVSGPRQWTKHWLGTTRPAIFPVSMTTGLFTKLFAGSVF